MTAVAGIFLLFLIAGIASGGSGEGVSTTPAADAAGESSSAVPEDSAPAASGAESKAAGSPKENAEPKSEAKSIGDKARDGKFEFTILALNCGKTQIGSQYLNQKAQGQFCLLSLKVRNIGDESRTFDGSNQFLFDSKNRKFEADTEAGIYLDDSKSFLEEINPGNVVRGVVVFDVPKNFAAKKAELHDSVWSGGVEINLG